MPTQTDRPARRRVGLNLACALSLAGSLLVAVAAPAGPVGAQPADPAVTSEVDEALRRFATSTTEETLVSMSPKRYGDTRAGFATFDGQHQGEGKRLAGAVWTVQMAGRGGIPADAVGVVVNITAIAPEGPGYVTAYKCGVPRPLTSSMNFVNGVNVANEVVAGLAADGTLCFYTHRNVHLALDVVAHIPSTSSITPVVPWRGLETRAGQPTADGQFQAIGRTSAGSTTKVRVLGRMGLPATGVDAVIANVTAVDALQNGFVTAHGCQASTPVSSTLNHVPGVNRGNEILLDVDANGDVCIFTQRALDLTLDITGYVPMGTNLKSVALFRAGDTRSGPLFPTGDGLFAGTGKLAAGEERKVRIGGRGNVPADARAAVINLTVADAEGNGFFAAHPCEPTRPDISSLTYTTGVNGANEVIVRLDGNGDVCIYSHRAAHMVLDVTGYLAHVPPSALEADLSITKTDSVDPIVAGNALSYTVDVTNNGPREATGVTVMDTLPAGVTFVSTAGCAEDPAGVPTCTLGTINAGASKQFTVNVTVDLATVGDIVNKVAVQSNMTDPDTGNNMAQETTTVIAPGTIEVVKATVPAGGTGFGFTDTIAVPNGFTLDDGQTKTFTVAPGTYTVTEDAPTDAALTDLACADPTFNSSTNLGTRTATIVVAAGETVTCTFTNTLGGTIIVEKQTLPDGDPQTFDFAGDASGTIGDGQQIVVGNVAPGTYTSTETVPAGWALTDITCDDGDSTGDTGTATATFDVAAGETVTCVFTNTKDGSISIEKQTLPDGDPATFDFAGDVAGTLGDGGIATQAVQPGAYTSTETVPAGWALTDVTCDDGNSTGDTGTATATFEVEPGEDVTCVFTNTKDGSISIEKQTLPDGDPATFDFAGDVAGTLGDGGIATQAVQPGTYTSTETVPAGWDLSDITCDDGNSTGDTGTATATFTVEPDEDVTCVFTNTKQGTIVVEKQTLPDGDPATFDFMGDAAGTIGDGQQIVVGNLVPGTYSATETVPAGWNLTDITCDDGNSSGDIGTATATFMLEAGETVKCVFTNTKRGSITIVKDAVPNDAQDFGFTGDLGPFTLDDDAGAAGEDATFSNSITFANVAPGAYDVTESDPSPANVSAINCDDGASATPSTGDTGTRTATVNVDPGEDVTCTFTNSYNTAPTITSPASTPANINAAENQTAVTDVDSTDDNDAEGAGLTYSFTTTGGGSAGADNGLFSLDANTGVVTFTSAPDHENPGDADTNGVYEVQVTVTDSGPGTPLTDFVDLLVTVTDVNDVPVITSNANQNADENQTSIATLTATDEDVPSQTLTWSETGGADAGLLSMSAGGVLTFDAAPDFETPTDANSDGVYEIDVRVTDNGAPNLFDDQTVLVTVNDVNEAPIARADTFGNQPVNVVLDAGAASASARPEVEKTDTVITEGTDDDDPDGDAITVTGIVGCADTTAPFTDCPTTGGGLVTMNADGSFTFVSEIGESASSDTFTYEISDPGGLSDTATVTINLGDTIWFIDDVIGSGGTGQSHDPFRDVGDFNAATTGIGDTVFLETGTHTDAGIDLLTDQLLIGEGAGLTSGDLTIPAGTAPTMAPLNDDAIDLASGNTVRGLDIGDTGTGIGIDGGAVGTLTIQDVDVSGTGRILNIGTSGGALSDIDFGTITSTSSAGTAAIDVTNYAGDFDVLGTTNISNADAGIDILGSNTTFDFGDATIGTTGIGTGIDITSSGGGTFTFDSIAVTTSAGVGVNANDAGTLNVGGAGNTVNATAGAALDIVNTSVGGGITFSDVTSTNSTGDGINLDTVTGTITATAGSITNTAAAGVDINAGSGDFTFGGSITNAAGRSVDVTSKAGADAITFGGTIIDTGTGINLDTNANATFTFSGGLTLDTGASTGLSANNSGTLNVTGTNRIGSTTPLSTTAINVQNTVLGAAGVTFQDVNVSGGTTGIDIDGGGSSGFFTITGVGTTDGSGGTIQNTTQNGILIENTDSLTITNVTLTNAASEGGGPGSCDGATFTGCNAALELNTTSAVDVTNLDLTGSGEHGVFGRSVTDFDLVNSTILNAGNGAHEHGVFFDNLLGTASGGTGSSVTGTTISNSGNHNMFVRNTTATSPGNAANPDLLQVSTSFFTNLLVANPNQALGLLLNSRNTANMRLEVTGDNNDATVEFSNLAAGGIRLNGDGGDLQSSIQDVTFGPGAGDLNGGVESLLTQDSTHSFLFNNNDVTIDANGAVEPAGMRVVAFDTASFDGDVTNNEIRNAVGSPTIIGISAKHDQGTAGNSTVTISGNTIVHDASQFGGRGIEILSGGTGRRMDAILTSNAVTFNNVGGTTEAPFWASGGQQGIVGASTLCIDYNGNDATNGASSLDEYVLVQFQGHTFIVDGLTGSGADATNVANYVNSQNTTGTAIVAPAGILGPPPTVVNYTAGTCNT